MRRKELQVIEIPKWGNYLRGKWREYFASHLSEEKQKTIGMDGFLWHLCSWEEVDYLANVDAKKVFQKQRKQKCLIFYQFIDEAFLINNGETLSIDDLPYDQLHMDYGDIYVMDWDGQWTFMMTHERQCGPYFIRKTKT